MFVYEQKWDKSTLISVVIDTT